MEKSAAMQNHLRQLSNAPKSLMQVECHNVVLPGFHPEIGIISWNDVCLIGFLIMQYPSLMPRQPLKARIISQGWEIFLSASLEILRDMSQLSPLARSFSHSCAF
jgi:hypothetical protein